MLPNRSAANYRKREAEKEAACFWGNISSMFATLRTLQANEGHDTARSLLSKRTHSELEITHDLTPAPPQLSGAGGLQELAPLAAPDPPQIALAAAPNPPGPSAPAAQGEGSTSQMQAETYTPAPAPPQLSGACALALAPEETHTALALPSASRASGLLAAGTSTWPIRGRPLPASPPKLCALNPPTVPPAQREDSGKHVAAPHGSTAEVPAAPTAHAAEPAGSSAKATTAGKHMVVDSRLETFRSAPPLPLTQLSGACQLAQAPEQSYTPIPPPVASGFVATASPNPPSATPTQDEGSTSQMHAKAYMEGMQDAFLSHDAMDIDNSDAASIGSELPSDQSDFDTKHGMTRGQKHAHEFGSDSEDSDQSDDSSSEVSDSAIVRKALHDVTTVYSNPTNRVLSRHQHPNHQTRPMPPVHHPLPLPVAPPPLPVAQQPAYTFMSNVAASPLHWQQPQESTIDVPHERKLAEARAHAESLREQSLQATDKAGKLQQSLKDALKTVQMLAAQPRT